MGRANAQEGRQRACRTGLGPEAARGRPRRGAGGARGGGGDNHRRRQLPVPVRRDGPDTAAVVAVWVVSVSSLLPGSRGLAEGEHGVADVLVLCHLAR